MEKLGFVVETPLIQRLQRRHFLLFDVLPLLLVLATPLYWSYLYRSYFEVLLFALMWLATGLGITVGYHRLFTHKSFQAAWPVQVILAILGSMAAQGGVTSWVAIHRLHHEKSDSEGDLHSPNQNGTGLVNRLKGLLHSHFLWMSRHPYPNVVRYAPDLLRNGHVAAINRNYYRIVLAGIVFPAFAGYLYHGDARGVLSGLYWGGVLRIFVLEHIIWSINSFLHVFGARDYETKESSRNVGALGLITLGESWHNNHHRFANSPSFGLKWYNLDPGFWLIKLFEIAGVAWDLRLPDAKQVDGRRLMR
ncbi:acyl-CoA desaturase [Cupriavidus sp. SK-3]|uniref:acyl-CoA desaturase n=1 Tax=Cupriavidus sp. SK-3 TaxID=1470558 RepID=UPI0005659B50|nr:fatty acid desaturase [Cupriavidus sp. SK-3]